jgi:hypothetical protein
MTDALDEEVQRRRLSEDRRGEHTDDEGRNGQDDS